MAEELKGAILRPDEIRPADRGNGAKTIPLVHPGLGAKSLINGITIFAPGAKIPFHLHNCEESVMVLSGDAIAVIDGTEHRLKAMDTTWIPANAPHRFINASDTEEMRIFWTYADVAATRTNVETGETRAVAAEHEKRL
ncbi:cupin domain-containing protein [Terrihabitans rhizophilus]|jgi:quercetin dioxygenase-like cupin family protein|uniref:Cupin domain-containing protein n=1 Tax=Terrihabitans rhizophilus TaxID=3092662 RepID=A0ABU4RL29_9HYPH|nr:cupin domain-containing protein [Terrihabitans sp. PJ23]MDX6805535.1 cupin domain-containing protein [Terrihabitans sp. PJ23]